MVPKRLLPTCVTVFVAWQALAQGAEPRRTPPRTTEVVGACQADLRTLCGGEPFQMSGLAQCVRRHWDQVSPGCRDVWSRIREPRQAAAAGRRSAGLEMRRACRADFKALCSRASPGQERSACMRDNQARFSEACRAALAALRSSRFGEDAN